MQSVLRKVLMHTNTRSSLFKALRILQNGTDFVADWAPLDSGASVP